MKSHSSTSILCVEPNIDTLLLLAFFLRSEGYDVTNAVDARSAIAYGLVRSYDILICDLTLPDGTGWEVMEELRESSHGLHTIALHNDTSTHATDMIDTAFGPAAPEAFDVYISKPFRFDVLKQALVARGVAAV